MTIDILLVEIKELEDKLAPLKKRLNELLLKKADDTKAKIERCLENQDSFTLDDLVFAAITRCECRAGMAYPKDIGIHGAWYCSDILLGRAKPRTDAESKNHSQPMPFVFWSVKSEDQPSMKGETTRPTE